MKPIDSNLMKAILFILEVVDENKVDLNEKEEIDLIE